MNSLFQQLNENGVAIAPSVLSADFSILANEITAVENGGADFLHLDVMDGHFVPNISFGPMIVRTIDKITQLPLITHLMIENPGDYVEEFIDSGSDVLSFHYEAMDEGHDEIIERIHHRGCAAGIAINPDTSLSEVEHLLDKVDLLLVMSVFPGFGGQKFMDDVIGKIEDAAMLKKSNKYSYVIEVDGGINLANAASVIRAGGQILVSGTGIFGNKDYRSAISGIRG